MTERLPNPYIDVERELSACIAEIGGQRVDDVIGKTDKKNADFLFDDYGVIAELKILEKDQIRSASFVDKCSAVYERYLRERRAPVIVFGTQRLSTEEFPIEFRQEIAELYANPIGRVIRSADLQIASTKKLLEKANHAGVLLIVNDGNSALDPSHVIWSLGHFLTGGAFPNINGVVFFTANMPVVTQMNTVAGLPSDMDLHVWFDGGRLEFPAVNERFGFDLRHAWLKHISGIVGRTSAFEGSSELLDSLTNRAKKR